MNSFIMVELSSSYIIHTVAFHVNSDNIRLHLSEPSGSKGYKYGLETGCNNKQ